MSAATLRFELPSPGRATSVRRHAVSGRALGGLAVFALVADVLIGAWLVGQAPMFRLPKTDIKVAAAETLLSASPPPVDGARPLTIRRR